ncbi:MAG TPA: methyltransferase [Pseudolabrys sp.]|nr:methyltransferase [Pseudolabrys sp.]
MTTDSETSEDAILGGRLRVRQPLRGHRVGHDAILLSAATCARATERAVELGAGVGAAAFAIAGRVPGLKVTLVEIDPALCALARHNARLNKLEDRVRVVDADAESIDSLKAAGLSPENFDRVLMNPPFHDARRHNVSPDPGRKLAHSGEAGLLRRWVASAAWLLKTNGVLVLIWRADALDEVIETLQPVFGAIAVLPVHPREDAAPIRVLVRAAKGGGISRKAYPPLILNDEEGRPTPVAEAIMRDGRTLQMAEA